MCGHLKRLICVYVYMLNTLKCVYICSYYVYVGVFCDVKTINLCVHLFLIYLHVCICVRSCVFLHVFCDNFGLLNCECVLCVCDGEFLHTRLYGIHVYECMYKCVSVCICVSDCFLIMNLYVGVCVYMCLRFCMHPCMCFRLFYDYDRICTGIRVYVIVSG